MSNMSDEVRQAWDKWAQQRKQASYDTTVKRTIQLGQPTWYAIQTNRCYAMC